MKISTRCPYEQSHKIIPNTYSVVKTGTIKNKAKKVIQRFQCKACGRYFSTNRILGIHKQRKPELNELIFSLYSKGMTQSRMKTRGRGMAAQFEAIREVKGWKKRKDGRYKIGIESFLVLDEYSKNQSRCLLLTDDKALYLNTFRFLDPKKWQHVHTRSDLSIVLLSKKKKWKPLVFTNKFRLSDKYVFAKVPFNVDVYETRTLLYEKLLNSAMKSYQKLCAVIRNDTSRLRRTTFINTQKPKMLELNLSMFIAYYNDYDFHQIMTYK
jgi:transposase-like protein